MRFLRSMRRTFLWVIRLGSLGLRLKIFVLALIGLTAIPPLYYLLQVRRCRNKQHTHDPHWLSDTDNHRVLRIRDPLTNP